MDGSIMPQIIPPEKETQPRLGGGGGAFNDEHLDLLSRVLDTWFRIPGTQIRFGLDGIVGFFPGIGDFIGGIASCIIVLAAFFRGVPLVTIARMVVNLAVEVGVGMVPLLGNLFDIGWRANRRNYHLLVESLEGPPRNTFRDWVFLVLFGLGLLVMTMLPEILLVWLGYGLWHEILQRGLW